MNKLIHLGATAALLTFCIVARSADSLTQNLQHGLFEEEANHNLDAAIKAYQAVVSQSDEQRKVVATALFRLGECYRKLGKTNEATAFYQRILREFADQEQLVGLSRENLSKSGSLLASDQPSGRVATNAEAEYLVRIRAMVKDSPDLVNSRDEKRYTPLHLAAELGYYSAAEFLIAHRANVNAVIDARNITQSLRGQTPLHRAAYSGHKKVVELLLSHGAEVNWGAEFSATALFLASANGYSGIVEVLLNNKADPNAFGPNGDQPLHVAARNGYTTVVAHLIVHGADVNGLQAYTPGSSAPPTTPLDLAARNRQTEVLELLLQHKANVNAKDSAGSTPLRWAAVDNSPQIVKMLLEAGAYPNIRNERGESALFGVSFPQIVQLLLKNKADPNTTNNAGQSALAALSSYGGNAEAIELLLKHGADPNRPDEHGTPLLFSAVFTGQRKVAELLLEHGANPNVLVNGETSLSLVQSSLKGIQDNSENGQELRRLEKLLLDKGANENLVRLSKLTYTRPGWLKEETWMTRGTNDFNRYTLFEFFGTLWSRKFDGEPTLPFPDLANVTILRVDPKTSTNTTIQVDLEAVARAGDCSKDIWLEWGDRVVIPELDHPLAETWKGPSPEMRSVLSKCMTRRVQIIVKNTTNFVTLIPPYLDATPASSPTEVPRRQERPSQETEKVKSTNSEQTLFTFRLKAVVIWSGLVRASSDTMRVRVSRLDPQMNQPKQWTMDLTRVQLPYDPGRDPSRIASEHDLWLRDGDVIEVPEKREPFGTTQATAPTGLRPMRPLTRPGGTPPLNVPRPQ